MSSGPATLPLADIITGDRLAALADAILLPRAIERRLGPAAPSSPATVRFDEHRSLDGEHLRALSASRSLFVYGHALPLFQAHVWPRLEGDGYVLITHNSDHEVGPDALAWADAAGGRLVHWFAQNLLEAHPKVTPLPIGIANGSWAHGDLVALEQTARPVGAGGLVHVAFDRTTHPDRDRAWDAARRAFGVEARPPVPYATYLGELVRHRFGLCPRGNGIDTHRFWECQYLGVVPVVERSPHTEMWAQLGLPVVLLDDWSELTRDRLEDEPVAVDAGPSPVLRLGHHRRLVRDAVARVRAS